MALNTSTLAETGIVIGGVCGSVGTFGRTSLDGDREKFTFLGRCRDYGRARCWCVISFILMLSTYSVIVQIPSEQHMMAFLHAPAYPLPFFSETTLTMTSRPIYMRLTEHHCLVQQPRIPVPRQKIGPFHDDGVQNAWFPGPPGSLRWDSFTDHQSGKPHIALYTHSGHTTEYQTFQPENAGTDWSGYEHDRQSCFSCRTRAELIEVAVSEERREFEEEQQRETENAFASVGLGREYTVSFDSGMDIDGEDEECEDRDSDVMDESEHYVDADLPPIRKTHDWIRNVVECDGIKDVMVTGAVSGASTLPILALIPFAD